MRRRACKVSRYGMRRVRLPVSAGFPACIAVLAVLGGCSQPLLVFRGETEAAAPVAVPEPTETGSIAKRPSSFGPDLGDEDWRRARAALGVALDPQGNGKPVKWDNPESGLRGSVNPT